MSHTPSADPSPPIGKRGATTGRAMIVIAIIAVVIIAIIVAVAASREGEAPEYAQAAPMTTPVFAEMTMDPDVDAVGGIADSKFVRDEVRDEFERYLRERLRTAEEETELGRHMQATLGLYQDQEALPSRVALIVTRARMLEEIEPDDVVLVAEFDDETARDRARQSIRMEAIEAIPVRDMPVLVAGGSTAAVQSVVQRLQADAEEGTLAATDELANVQEINRGPGLFVYFDVRGPYEQWLRETAAQQAQGTNPTNDRTEIEPREVTRALRDLLPPEKMGGLGIWIGPWQTEMFLPIEDNPLAQEDILAQGGTEILDYLPYRSIYVTKLSMLAGEADEMHQFMRERAPQFLNLIETIRRHGVDELREQTDVVDFNRLRRHLDEYGDLAEGHIGGAVFPLDPATPQNLSTVVVLPVTDIDEARTRLWQAKAQLDLEGEWEAVEIEVDGEAVNAVHLGEAKGIVVFRDNSAIYMAHAPMDRAFTPRDVQMYFAHLDQLGTVTDHDGWSEGMSEGVSFEHTFVSALNVAALTDLFDLDEAVREYQRAQELGQGGNQQPRQQPRQEARRVQPQSPLADVFVAKSLNVEDDGIRGYVSAGLADLAALLVLTDFALQRRGVDPVEEIEQVADRGDDPMAREPHRAEGEIDRSSLEEKLSEYQRAVELERRDPNVEEFLGMLEPREQDQLRGMEPRLDKENGRLVLTATDPQTGETIRIESEGMDADMDRPGEGEEPFDRGN